MQYALALCSRKRLNILEGSLRFFIFDLTLAILLYFQSLLDEPNPNSPANNVAAQLYQNNRREYEKRVRVVVVDSWICKT